MDLTGGPLFSDVTSLFEEAAQGRPLALALDCTDWHQ